MWPSFLSENKKVISYPMHRQATSFCKLQKVFGLHVLAISLSRTLQTRSAALSRSNTASLVQETLSTRLDIRSPFLHDQSLLKVPFLIGYTK